MRTPENKSPEEFCQKPERDMSPTAPAKRIVLYITPRGDDRISFRLYRLEPNAEEGTPLVQSSRRVSPETIRELQLSWSESIANLEKNFEEQLEREFQSLLNTLQSSKGRVREQVVRSPKWKRVLEEASRELMEQVGDFVFNYSSKIRNQVLPDDEVFWRAFEEHVDSQITRDAESGTVHWEKMPLLQLKIEQALLVIPWWLARTKDRKSLWCCRYALAVSPTGPDTTPPKLRFEDLRILTITRPTIDLAPWFPISKEAFEVASPILARWQLADGVVGITKPPKTDELFSTPPASPKFLGVTYDGVQALLEDCNDLLPNLFFYHGHWQSGDSKGPEMVLHNPDIGIPALTYKNMHVPVPLLSIAPPDKYRNSIFIMQGCSSAAPDKLIQMQEYLDKDSVFVGVTYPLLASAENSAAADFLRNILNGDKEPYLAQSLARANNFDGLPVYLDDGGTRARELYQKAALCLFGDVRAHLYKIYNEVTRDNLQQVKVRAVKRWSRLLEQMSIRGFGGLDYSTVDIDDELSPTANFAPADGEISMAPLAQAVHLCSDHRGKVTILGPAVASRSSVGLGSLKWKTKTELVAHIRDCQNEGKKVRVGVLDEKLTSTYMACAAIAKAVSGSFATTIPHQLMDVLELKTPPWSAQGDPKALVTDKFLHDVDLSLVLDEGRMQLPKGFEPLLWEDLEKETLAALGSQLQSFPRAVFLATTESLRNEEQKKRIEEFLEAFNKRVTASDLITGEIGLPLKTYDQSDLNQLELIRQFTGSRFLGIRELGWEYFAVEPAVSQTAVRKALDLLDLKDFPTVPRDTHIKFDRELRLGKEACKEWVSSQGPWRRVDALTGIVSAMRKAGMNTAHLALVQGHLESLLIEDIVMKRDLDSRTGASQ